jgi:hypothetical protein
MCWRFADPRDPTDFDKTRLNRPNEKDTSVPKSNAMNGKSSSATKEMISYLYDKSAIERRHKTEARLAIIRQLPAKNILLFPA